MQINQQARQGEPGRVVSCGNPRGSSLPNPSQLEKALRAELDQLRARVSEIETALGESGPENEPATRALRESEGRLRAFYDAAFEGIGITEDGRIVDVNRQLCEMLGYEREELIGSDVTTLVAPEDRELVFEHLRTGRAEPYEHRSLHKDGSVVHVEVRGGCGEVEGRPVRVTAIHDISERKRAAQERERMMAAIEQLAETIVITDAQGCIEYVNPAFERSTGYSRSEALGQNLLFLQPPESDEDLGESLWDVLRAGLVWTGRIQTRRRDGRVFEEDCTVSPVRDLTSSVVNFVAVKRDVTRELELEKQLRHAQKLESIGTLAGGIAHDINNVLATVANYTDLAQQSLTAGSHACQDLAEVLVAVRRGKALVDQILTFSRRAELHKEVIDIGVAVREAVGLLRASTPPAVRIHQHLDSGAGTVLANASQVQQIVMNLATNAIQAMGDAGGDLELRLSSETLDHRQAALHAVLAPGEYAVLRVKDTGSGMDSETLARAFEPFFTTKPLGEGTGMGLSVVHGIVAEHGGGLTVRSDQGRGTEVVVYLPRAKAESEERPNPQPASRGASQHVLLVDDELMLVSSVQRLLQKLGYRVTAVDNPLEALELVRLNPQGYACVLTDQAMPQLSGMRLAAQLRLVRRDLPIVLCTGYGASIDAQDARSAGICAVLAKPFQRDELATVLRHALGG